MTRLNEREESVLRTIIEEYVESSEPVGSRNVSKVGPLKMSPATIRNIMSDLEDKGYIFQPHTSSGRIPTDSGYRYYIDRLVTFDMNDADSVRRLRESMKFDTSNIQNLFKNLTRRVGELTQSVGFVMAPKVDTMFLKHIEFLRINRQHVLAIIVTRTGFVHNVMLNIDASVTDSELVRASNFLNEQFANRSLREVRMTLIRDLVEKKEHMDGLVEHVRLLGTEAFGRIPMENDFVFEGTTNILGLPEFRDLERLREFFRAFEEKQFIYQLIERCMDENGIQIFVGSEIGQEAVSEMGMVIKPYGREGSLVGMIGVLGPKRMRYPQVVSVVEYSAAIISNLLNDVSGGNDE